MYQIHIPCRSSGELPAGTAIGPAVAGGSPISPAPPVSADAAEGRRAIAKTERIARSARLVPGAGVRLALTSIRNTVPPAPLRSVNLKLSPTGSVCGVLASEAV